MNMNNSSFRSHIFGDGRIHCEIYQHSPGVASLQFGLGKPNLDNHKQTQGEIECYLFGMAFKSEKSVDVIIEWLKLLKIIMINSTQFEPCYSQENQEADYAEK